MTETFVRHIERSMAKKMENNISMHLSKPPLILLFFRELSAAYMILRSSIIATHNKTMKQMRLKMK